MMKQRPLDASSEYRRTCNSACTFDHKSRVTIVDGCVELDPHEIEI